MKRCSRRDFLVRSGSMGLAAAFSAGAYRNAWPDPLGIPIGIQLWAVNSLMTSDPAGTLQKLRKIGYQKIESAGLGKLSAAEFRKLLDDADLSCPSIHFSLATGRLESAFEVAHTLGAAYVASSILRLGSGGLPFTHPEPTVTTMRAMTLDDARKTAELANQTGEKAKKAGLQYAYHNHFFEFVDQGRGQIAYDILLQETDADLVQFELDCGWMKVAGRDPVRYLKKYPQRFPMLHIKDFLPIDEKDPNGAVPVLRLGAEIGHGVIDYRPIFAAAKGAHLKHYFVEQEGPFARMDQLEAAQVGFNYLHAMN
jgi:sugar phosphate isomerase/epimerase